MSTKIQDPEEARSARDRFLDYMWAVTQDDGGEVAIRAQAIQTLAEVYSSPPFTDARDPGPGRVRIAVGVAIGLAVGVLVGLVLA